MVGRASARLEAHNASGANVAGSYLLLWQHTLNGAAGDHILQLGGVEGFVLIE